MDVDIRRYSIKVMSFLRMTQGTLVSYTKSFDITVTKILPFLLKKQNQIRLNKNTFMFAMLIIISNSMYQQIS